MVLSELTIPAGATNFSFDVSILDDDVVEGMESFELVFTLDLGDEVPQSLKDKIKICGDNNAIIKIIDDDGKYRQLAHDQQCSLGSHWSFCSRLRSLVWLYDDCVGISEGQVPHEYWVKANASVR